MQQVPAIANRIQFSMISICESPSYTTNICAVSVSCLILAWRLSVELLAWPEATVNRDTLCLFWLLPAGILYAHLVSSQSNRPWFCNSDVRKQVTCAPHLSEVLSATYRIYSVSSLSIREPRQGQTSTIAKPGGV